MIIISSDCLANYFESLSDTVKYSLADCFKSVHFHTCLYSMFLRHSHSMVSKYDNANRIFPCLPEIEAEFHISTQYYLQHIKMF